MSAPARFLPLDLLRGLAVAGMILVTSPGDWAAAYAPLRHAEWDGWTLADMVFPAFLFSVGVALGLSFPRPLATPEEGRRYRRRVARRVAALIGLGLALEATHTLAVALGAPHLGGAGLENMRLPGILQRIALCYAIASAVMAWTAQQLGDDRAEVSVRGMAAAIAVLLVSYWAAMLLVPVPGYGTGRLDPAGNLAGYVDRLAFTVPHLWALGWAAPGGPVFYDPEGLLSTLSATADVLFGALAALAWRRAPDRSALAIAAAGAVLMIVGALLDPLIPINKRIWTPSFALLSSGFAALALAALAVASRSAVARTLLVTLEVLGGNAILAFVLSTLIGRVYSFPLIGAKRVSPQAWLNGEMLALVGDPPLASLLCAAIVLAAVIALLWPLHRRALHFRL